MIKKKIICIAATLALVAVLSVGVTLAAFKASVETTNTLTFGNVHVDLVDVYTKPEKGVVPGQTVEKIVYAQNTGSNMQYVRLKLTKSWWEDGQERKDLDPSYIELNFVNPDKWILGEDGYYYYQLPLAAGQTAENLIESFSLPKAWDMKGYTELDGHIDAFAEAVQYENFKPQLNAQGQIVGWNDIVIENAVDRLPQQEEIQGDTGTSVIYQLGAEKFVTLPDEDLFKGFKGLMPGDTRTQVIHIGNEDEKMSFIYLYALQADEDAFESAEQKAISDELMQLLTVTITNEKDDSVIYSGKLYGEEGSFSMYGEAQAICLGGFAQGESADLTVELQVPTELNNRYADAVGKIKWIFTCSQEDPPVEQPTQPPTEPMTEPATQPSTEPMTEPATQPTNPPKAPDIVTTGDIYTVPVLAAAAAATAAILAIAVLLIKRRKKNSMRE